jgi:formate dehydrogenase maturation protein FdhE
MRKSPVWKYVGASQDFITGRQDGEEDGNFIYYRLADIYLMKAEALIELNQITEANEILRIIAERAAQPYEVLTSQDGLREQVLKERARELAFEGKRWFDLLRYAKRDNFKRKNYLIDVLLQGSDVRQRPIYKARLIDTMSYFLPIPENDILFNPNLTQNPYYDR